MFLWIRWKGIATGKVLEYTEFGGLMGPWSKLPGRLRALWTPIRNGESSEGLEFGSMTACEAFLFGFLSSIQASRTVRFRLGLVKCSFFKFGMKVHFRTPINMVNYPKVKF